MSLKLNPLNRPEFMISLGLNPPYTENDVKQAYRQKAKSAHPDAGGSQEAYMALHDAYQQALDYAKFHASRTRWIADEVEIYTKRVSILTDVEAMGGVVTMQRLEGLRTWVGEDFSQLKDRLIAIQMRGKSISDASLQCLIDGAEALNDVQHLDLAHSSITSAGLARLTGLTELTVLDLHDTPVDNNVADFLKGIPTLQWVHLGGTKVTWLGRQKIRLARPGLEIASRVP